MDLIQWTQNIAIHDFPESRQLAFPEHVAIMEAVCAHDATAAAHAMRAHLENAYRRMDRSPARSSECSASRA